MKQMLKGKHHQVCVGYRSASLVLAPLPIDLMTTPVPRPLSAVSTCAGETPRRILSVGRTTSMRRPAKDTVVPGSL